ncbi:MAG: hypothetical protein ACKO83_14245, partial [Roseiflexaceae bacterium]
VWDVVWMCVQWVVHLPWGQWSAPFTQMTLPEWAGFLASLFGIVAFFIGIPRLWSFHYTQRYRTFVELYKLNEQLMSRLRANDVATAKTYREALRDSIHANSFEFSRRDYTYIYTQWQKANTQAHTLISAMEEQNARYGDLPDIAELIELRGRLHGEIKKLRNVPISLNDN